MTDDLSRPLDDRSAANDAAEAIEPNPVVRLQISAVAKLNLADFQNAVPALHELAVVNETAAAIDALTIQLVSEPAFIKSRTWSLESVGAGETYHLTDLDVQLDGALLSRLTEAESAALRFELRSRKQPEAIIARHERTVCCKIFQDCP